MDKDDSLSELERVLIKWQEEDCGQRSLLVIATDGKNSLNMLRGYNLPLKAALCAAMEKNEYIENTVECAFVAMKKPELGQVLFSAFNEWSEKNALREE